MQKNLKNNDTKKVIRTIQKKDLMDAKGLIEYLMEVEDVDNPGKQAELIIKQRIIPTIKSGKNKTFVVDLGGKIIGLALIEIRPNLVASTPYLVINKSYQKQGFGNNIVNYVCNYAKNLGVKVLEVTIHKDNKKSLIFHKKLGFDLFGFVLRKEI